MTTGVNTQKLVSGRQEPCVAEFVLTYDQAIAVGSGVRARCIFLPQGAVLHKVNFVIEAAFNSATSDTLALAFDDGTAILAATDIHTGAAARVAASEANLGVERSAVDYLTFTWTGVSTAPTAGKVRIFANYTLEGREHYNHGVDGYPNTGHA